MGGTIGAILAQVLVALVQWFAGRKDLKDSVKGEMLLNAAKQVQTALEWKAGHPIDTSSPISDDFKLRGPNIIPGTTSSGPVTPPT